MAKKSKKDKEEKKKKASAESESESSASESSASESGASESGASESSASSASESGASESSDGKKAKKGKKGKAAESESSSSSSESGGESESSASESGESGKGKKGKGKKGGESESESESGESKSSSSSESESESESDDGGASGKEAPLVQIDVDKYQPKAPSMPIPQGIEDCFGRYNDPDVLECQKCVEFKNCRAVQKARQAEEDKGGKKKMAYKHKHHHKEDKKEKKEEKKAKKGKGPSEVTQGILDTVKKYSDVKGSGSKLYLLVNKKKVAKITRANTDEPTVQLRFKGGPKELGIKAKYWKGKGSRFNFKGDIGKLGGYLKAAFKAIKAKK